MSAREHLIDASAYWRIDRGAVLAAAWRDHLERGLVWICLTVPKIYTTWADALKRPVGFIPCPAA